MAAKYNDVEWGWFVDLESADNTYSTYNKYNHYYDKKYKSNKHSICHKKALLPTIYENHVVTLPNKKMIIYINYCQVIALLVYIGVILYFIL